MIEHQFSHYVYDTLHITFYDDVEPLIFCRLVFNNQLHSRKNNSKIPPWFSFIFVYVKQRLQSR